MVTNCLTMTKWRVLCLGFRRRGSTLGVKGKETDMQITLEQSFHVQQWKQTRGIELREKLERSDEMNAKKQNKTSILTILK